MAIGTERRSHSADSGITRTQSKETDAMMREYFVEMTRERRERLEREAREAELRREKEARTERERRRQQRILERRQYEEDRDERLLRRIRGEFRDSQDDEGERKNIRAGKSTIRRNEYGETKEEEKERLLRTIASLEPTGEEEEDDAELVELRRRAAALKLGLEKRKRPVVESPVGNSPPMVTPTKGQRTSLSKEAKTRIEEIQGADPGKGAGPSSVKKNILASLEPTGKLGISLKHITAGVGPGAREKYETEVRDLFEVLTIDELKEQCKLEKIGYGNRELAIKRLVGRRVIKVYDPVNVPLPVNPRASERLGKRNSTLKIQEDVATDDSLADESDEEDV
ncbi:hypothetical protein CBR_g19270 [Chara braunii]|uniref:Uncharacterized protein n=1 Tax=Chara braunii TaxID=69332 RepID=A0A388KXI1_CHABU|nr:hypothetical protein CBR_g19270 [Chara braunii]|eukprot:GBG74757.1 hypothetical protein CBR_g19270 [Chara braunii]